MRVGQYYFCDSCKEPIYDPHDGFIVHGNIYVADPSCRGGLIGNNFPDAKPGDKIEVADVKEVVYCRRCFEDALDSKEQQPEQQPEPKDVPPPWVPTSSWGDDIPF